VIDGTTAALDELTEAEWSDRLSPAEYRILRESGTERAGTSELDVEGDGEFRCVGCGQVLYRTGEKYDSGTGWPSFWAPADEAAIETHPDVGILGFGTRTEVVCSNCGGHLGHVFDDGPRPTGKRHCIDGVALAFEAADGDEGERGRRRPCRRATPAPRP
jgi:peptide-methionine (R)-S-oxide reductase